MIQEETLKLFRCKNAPPFYEGNFMLKCYLFEFMYKGYE